MTVRAPRASEVRISNPDKVLFPDDGIDKRDLAGYYEAVAPAMVRLCHGRPVTMQRFPNGIAQPGFMQKNAMHVPPWVRTVDVPKASGTVRHVTIENDATLLWLADQACVTPHLWLSRADRITNPDRMVFDLDPPGDEAAAVRRAALSVRGLLVELDLPAYAMSTGSRGVHVVVPLDRGAGTDEARRFAHDVAALLVARNPESMTLEFGKRNRGTRVYLDIARNGYAQTTVAPYAVRPLPRAPVAIPVEWGEIEDRDFQPRRWTLRSVPARLEGQGDAWASIGRHPRSLRSARARLEALRAEAV